MNRNSKELLDDWLSDQYDCIAQYIQHCKDNGYRYTGIFHKGLPVLEKLQ